MARRMAGSWAPADGEAVDRLVAATAPVVAKVTASDMRGRTLYAVCGVCRRARAVAHGYTARALDQSPAHFEAALNGVGWRDGKCDKCNANAVNDLRAASGKTTPPRRATGKKVQAATGTNSTTYDGCLK